MIFKACENLLLAVKYNIIDKEHQGYSHGIVPGLIWKSSKSSVFSPHIKW